MYEQVLNKVTPEYKDKINLYEVNIEQEPEIAGLFKVMSVPTTTTISKNGDTYSQPGVLNEETLKYFLEGLLQKK
jgi:thioredoxin-like negative regulator of GroEL